MKLNKKDLRNLIVQEINKMQEDALLIKHSVPGNTYASDAIGVDNYKKTKHSMCRECGASIYEGESSCSECGNAMYESDINEGFCGGCGSCSTCGDIESYKIEIGGHNNYKGAYMAKSQMYKVSKYAEKLYKMIPDGHNLEDWMRTKLAQIADDIDEVYHALEHDIYEGDV